MDHSLDIRRKKLLFRSVRRGTKESDMVIGAFAQACLGELDSRQLDRFEALLEQNDQDLLGWVSGTLPVPPEHDNDVLNLLQTFKTGQSSS